MHSAMHVAQGSSEEGGKDKALNQGKKTATRSFKRIPRSIAGSHEGSSEEVAVGKKRSVEASNSMEIDGQKKSKNYSGCEEGNVSMNKAGLAFQSCEKQ